jgi:hypothetical protein
VPPRAAAAPQKAPPAAREPKRCGTVAASCLSLCPAARLGRCRALTPPASRASITEDVGRLLAAVRAARPEWGVRQARARRVAGRPLHATLALLCSPRLHARCARASRSARVAACTPARGASARQLAAVQLLGSACSAALRFALRTTHRLAPHARTATARCAQAHVLKVLSRVLSRLHAEAECAPDTNAKRQRS